MTEPVGIDPRGPRFAATITTVLLLAALVLSLVGISTARAGATWFAYQPLADAVLVSGSGGWALDAAPLAQRALDPGFLLLLIIALLFLWGVLSPGTAPWGALFRRLVRPRLAPPSELEDPRPPRFAQGVGLFVVTIGLALHLIGVPWALPVAAGAAFIAAFLNAAFDFCLGCQIYLLLQRAGIIGRSAPAS
ncbi:MULTISPECIES: DUF4395 domain-containing protein [unclassified Microbacterium]|uniref:DUF4395 domain-containing protein n=1 Tax=unclassified Microbacterium TaxID=2609290 RepID=UPI00216798E0|nr:MULTISPECIES: DUF4395 domain-containing protein [unclassified Microbacterium]MCS3842303.1 hypothetical protein [Microbacterium sp. AK031]MDP3952906.1 DUF4395 domain-containing protein [Microbacterium sp.]